MTVDEAAAYLAARGFLTLGFGEIRDNRLRIELQEELPAKNRVQVVYRNRYRNEVESYSEGFKAGLAHNEREK